MQTCDTHSDSDFAAENLTARHDVEIPELGLLPPVEVELKEDGPEDRERFPVDADPCFLPVVQHGIGDGDLKAAPKHYLATQSMFIYLQRLDANSFRNFALKHSIYQLITQLQLANSRSYQLFEIQVLSYSSYDFGDVAAEGDGH